MNWLMGECLRGDPAVFDRSRPDWIHPESASAERVAEIVSRCPSGALHAPDEVMAYAVFLTAPDGNKVFAIPVCYVGPVDMAEQVLRPLRDFAGPAANSLAPMDYCQIQSMFDGGFPPGRLHYWKSSFLRHLSDKAIDTIVEYFGAVPSPMSAVAIEPFGGAVARVGVEETAFPHRDASFSIVMLSGPLSYSSTRRHARLVTSIG